ncbi:MAG: citrate lyase holo-[acyl-carrier protein] synthase [Clostridia bacterium]|nr:citrate lyase holo-[acyl-carrier protein] synthase [Clostridia bacterium]
MSEATLIDVLAARDRRAELQQKMLSSYGLSLISFTLNIAGPIKADAWAAYAFRQGKAALMAALGSFGYPIRAEEEVSSPAGYEWMAAVDTEAVQLKKICVSIEHRHRMGRLFDMDVIAADGLKISREEERACLVCGKPGRGCASRRLHPLT